jgi:hypothetical protein
MVQFSIPILLLFARAALAFAPAPPPPTPALTALSGPSDVRAGECHEYRITLSWPAGTAIPAWLNLAISRPENMYKDPGCLTPTRWTNTLWFTTPYDLEVPGPSTSVLFYYKPYPGAVIDLHVSETNGYASTTNEIRVSSPYDAGLVCAMARSVSQFPLPPECYPEIEARARADVITAFQDYTLLSHLPWMLRDLRKEMSVDWPLIQDLGRSTSIRVLRQPYFDALMRVAAPSPDGFGYVPMYDGVPWAAMALTPRERTLVLEGLDRLVAEGEIDGDAHDQLATIMRYETWKPAAQTTLVVLNGGYAHLDADLITLPLLYAAARLHGESP